MTTCFRIILIVSAVMMTLSCGKQSQAEDVVKDFLAESLRDNSYTASFTKIDSTRNVADSMITKMRAAAAKNAFYKSGLKFAGSTFHDRYVYTRVTLIKGKDTVVQTYYLDPEIKTVIAFKEN